MFALTRRQFVAATGVAALVNQSIAVAQADSRPTITIAVQKIANNNTLEIAHEASNVATRWYNLIKEPMIDTDWTGNVLIRPGLAEKWKRIDSRTVELTLREGVKFHNGDALEPEDVAFSFGPDRLFGVPERQKAGAADPKSLPASLPRAARAAYPSLEAIEIVDRRTVRFVNKTPDLTLEGRIAMRVGCILNRRSFQEAASWLDWVRKPIGTGPYKVREFKPDTHLILDAFDEYWDGLPPIKTIRFLEIPELASRMNGLASGEYDFACDITPDQIAAIEKDSRFDVVGGPILNQRVVVFDKSNPVLADARVRRAFGHALDRKLIVDALWAGRTDAGNGLQYPFFDKMFIEDWKLPEFNPDLARQLLKDASYKGEPISYRVLNNYYTAQVSTAQIMVEMWRAVGLNVIIEMKENWGQILAKGGGRAIYDNSSSAFFNDPVSYVPGTFGPNGSYPQAGLWSNEEFYKLIPVLESSVDPEERRRVYRRMLEITERDDPAITVMHQTANFTAKRRNIAWKPAKSFVMDFRARNFSVRAS
ncbi:DdpA ABC-type dipeptide transport system, periplasmic component [Rhabdaerophilaceae bacterium]